MTRKISKTDKVKKDKDLEKQKQALLNRRENLISSLSILSHQGKKTERKGDSSDLAATSRDEELNLLLSDHERQELMAIDDALTRIEEGTYGFCEECDSRISFKRLEALPFAKYCVDCQSERENKDKLTRQNSSELLVNLFSDTIKLADLESGSDDEESPPAINELDDNMENLEFEGKDLENLQEEENEEEKE